LSPEGVALHQYSVFKRREYRFAPRKPIKKTYQSERINIGVEPGAAASKLAVDNAPR
jgi:hypothetical protein